MSVIWVYLQVGVRCMPKDLFRRIYFFIHNDNIPVYIIIEYTFIRSATPFFYKILLHLY
jgi:hypothetical protein